MNKDKTQYQINYDPLIVYSMGAMILIDLFVFTMQVTGNFDLILKLIK